MALLWRVPQGRRNSYSRYKLGIIDDHVNRILDGLEKKKKKFEELCSQYSRVLFDFPLRLIKEMINLCWWMLFSTHYRFTRRYPYAYPFRGLGEILEYICRHDFENLRRATNSWLKTGGFKMDNIIGLYDHFKSLPNYNMEFPPVDDLEEGPHEEFMDLFHFDNIVCTPNGPSLELLFQFDDYTNIDYEYSDEEELEEEYTEPPEAWEALSMNDDDDDEEYSIPDSVLDGAPVYVPTPLAQILSAESDNMEVNDKNESDNEEEENSGVEYVSVENADWETFHELVRNRR